MKQKITFVIAVFSLLVASLTSWGQIRTADTIDFSQQGYANELVITDVPINANLLVSFSKGTGTNTPKYFNTGTAIRCYGGNTFTVVGESVQITKITLTFGASDGSNAITTDVGTFASPTWTGTSSSVKFTIGGTSGHRKIKSIAVSYVPIFHKISSHTLVNDTSTYMIVDVHSGKALSYQNGTASAPPAIAVSISGDSIVGPVSDSLLWNVVATTGGHTLYPAGDITRWLYTTNANNGVRIGTNTEKVWTLDITDASAPDYHGIKHNGQSRYLGVYNNQDWRAYTTIGTNIKLTQIEFFVFGPAPVPSAVKTPTFSPEGGSFMTAQNVTISCATAGATIYYTTDGTDPTTSSSVYSSAISVTADMTIKAMGVLTGLENSAIASATYQFVSPITIAAARALDNNASACVEGIVTFIDGRNVYIQDSTAGIVLYLNTGTVPTALAPGDIVEAIGTKTVYHNLVELSGINGSSQASFIIISTGNALPTETLSIAAINADFADENMLQSTRVKIENAIIGTINTSGSTEIRQDTNSMVIYRIPTVAGMLAGDLVTVTGVLSAYNTLQLRVSSADDIQYTHRPNLTADPNMVSGMNYVHGNGPSEIANFALSGHYLTDKVTLTPPADFEISSVGGSLFDPESPMYVYPPLSGGFNNLNIYVRLKEGLEIGTYNDTLTITTEGGDALYVRLLGSVTENGGGTVDYVRIADLSGLTDGSQLIMAARYNDIATNYVALQNTLTSGKLQSTQFISETSGSDEIIPASIVADENTYVWTVNVSGSSYTFTNNNGDVIGYGSSTSFVMGGNKTSWTVSRGVSDTASMVPSYTAFKIVNDSTTTRAFAINNTYHSCGAYATSNMTGSNASGYNFFIDMFVKSNGGTPTVATPTFTPAAGTYYAAQTVTIACSTEGATIHYTLDGTDPTETSPVYTSALTISETTTVKAIAVKEDYNPSAIATAVYTIQLGVVAIFDQDWEGEMNGWTFVNVEGTAQWSVALYSGNHYASVNGYNNGANTDWCISPAFNLNNYDNPTLTFKTAKNYPGHDLEVFFSNNYDGTNPGSATWTALPCTLSTGSWTWTESGSIDLSSYSGTNCYVGFKYTCTDSVAAAWEVDDILLVGSTSNPILTATPTTLGGFTYVVGNGPSAEQSFTVSGLNLTNDVTIAQATDYEISTVSGSGFTAQSSIVLSPSNGVLADTTIYVRLKAGLAVGTYNSEQIAISSTGATSVAVTCNGNVGEEGSGDDWRRIASASELTNGCKVILAARYNSTASNYYAMPSVASGKPDGVACTTVTSGDDEIMPAAIANSAETYYWNVVIADTSFIFINAAGDTIGYPGSGTDFSNTSDNSAWGISTGTSAATAMVPNYTAFNIINDNFARGFALRSSYKFGAYATSNMASVEYNFFIDIFMQGEGGTPTVANPTFNPAGGTYYEAQNVTITSATQGATVYYSTTGENGPWTAYVSPIAVEENMTIWAYAEKADYNNSAVVSATYEIIGGVTVIFNQDWEEDWNGWTEVSVAGETNWDIATYNNNHYAYINAYNHGANEDWLISPAFDLDSYENVRLSFRTAKNFQGNDIEVFFSNDYDGSNPSTATWQPITCPLSSGSWAWVESGDINMDAFSGNNCYVAYKYTSNDSVASAWEVDDIMLMSGEAGPTITATPQAVNGLTYVVSQGPSEAQTYELTASALVGSGNISVVASDDFEISLTGDTFGSTLEVPFADSVITGQPVTVYVRLKADLEVGTYEGTIVHEGGEATCTVTLNGSVTSGDAPSISEAIVPLYIQGMNGTNNNRLPYAFRLTLSNLTPNATYRYINQIVDATDGATANGAGNIIYVNGQNFYRTTSPSMETEGGYGVFTADSEGSYSGWFVSEATANTRFTPGNHVFMRVRINDGNNGTSAVNYLTTTDYATVLNFGEENNEYQGTAIRAISGNTPKDFVFLYDNAQGEGRPLYGASIETTGIDYASINQYATFYKDEVAGNDGHWGGIIPNVNENGVQYIAVLSNEDGSLVDSYSNESGIWGDENTINPTGGLNDVIVLNLVGLNVDDDAASTVKVWSADHELIIQNSGENDFRMTVYNILGQPVLAQDIFGESTQRISHNLAAGAYVVTLLNNTSFVSTKIIVR